MLDALVVGAGPAGAVAAALLARSGARVRLVDRAVFPRDKLCGDTVNPGTLATLDRLRLAAAIETRGLPIDGMRVSGTNGFLVEGRYPAGRAGRALLRRDFDWMLLQDAIDAGAQFEPGVAVTGALVDGGRVAGARIGSCELRARVTIAADGRRSTLAFGLGLASHPQRPRRWAVGAYIDAGVDEASGRFGEMHLRGEHYIGVAAVPGGLTNVCLVTPWRIGDAPFGDAWTFMSGVLSRDVLLRDRFAGASPVRRPVVLGPLAVDARPSRIEGLLLAGDAAGFIDPMTGDGLHFAVRGAELTARAALDALTHGWNGVHGRLSRARRKAFSSKWRFNRGVRALAGSPAAVAAATAGARIAPQLVRRAMLYAGDVSDAACTTC